jgi:hypothetical protein
MVVAVLADDPNYESTVVIRQLSNQKIVWILRNYFSILTDKFKVFWECTYSKNVWFSLINVFENCGNKHFATLHWNFKHQG